MSIAPSRAVRNFWNRAGAEMLHLRASEHISALRPWYARVAARHDSSAPRRWLDYGVGGGAGCILAYELGFDVTGCDVSDRAWAPEQVPILAPEDLAAVARGHFTAITSVSTFQHFESERYARAVLAEMRRLAAPRCSVLIHVRWGASPQNESGPYELRATHAHTWTRDGFTRALTDAGFYVDESETGGAYGDALFVLARG